MESQGVMNAGNAHLMALWVNQSCAFGKGGERWLSISRDPRIAQAITNVGSEKSCAEWVRDCLGLGVERFVAVGGDGTVNLVANVLAKTSASVYLGAIGTGSSNDFHKPARERIHGFPCRLNFEEPVQADLLRVRDVETNEVRYGLVNASVGITAEANHYFNRPDRVLSTLKRKSPNLAILYAALRTLWLYRAQTLRLDEYVVRVTNLGLVKNRHFSGSFKYDESAEPDSGDFLAYLCHDLGRFGSLKALFRLSRGVFVKSPKSAKFRARKMSIKAGESFAFELDGEVMRSKNVEVNIDAKRIWLCP